MLQAIALSIQRSKARRAGSSFLKPCPHNLGPEPCSPAHMHGAYLRSFKAALPLTPTHAALSGTCGYGLNGRWSCHIIFHAPLSCCLQLLYQGLALAWLLLFKYLWALFLLLFMHAQTIWLVVCHVGNLVVGVSATDGVVFDLFVVRRVLFLHNTL